MKISLVSNVSNHQIKFFQKAQHFLSKSGETLVDRCVEELCQNQLGRISHITTAYMIALLLQIPHVTFISSLLFLYFPSSTLPSPLSETKSSLYCSKVSHIFWECLDQRLLKVCPNLLAMPRNWSERLTVPNHAEPLLTTQLTPQAYLNHKIHPQIHRKAR